MSGTILILNAGSSSIKFQLFAPQGGEGLERRLKGEIEGIGTNPHLTAESKDGRSLIDKSWAAAELGDAATALDHVLDWLTQELRGEMPLAVGHRVVHGGTRFTAPILVDDAVIAGIEGLVPLAPLHQPNNLAPIQILRRRLPQLPQVACFDTAFHRGHPPVADHFAIPEALYEEGVRRYGFHGSPTNISPAPSQRSLPLWRRAG